MNIKLTWEEFKLVYKNKQLQAQYVTVSGRYRLFALDIFIVYECHLIDASEIAEFEGFVYCP